MVRAYCFDCGWYGYLPYISGPEGGKDVGYGCQRCHSHDLYFSGFYCCQIWVPEDKVVSEAKP